MAKDPQVGACHRKEDNVDVGAESDDTVERVQINRIIKKECETEQSHSDWA